jgi:ferredoxin-nitrite reductase
VSVTRRSGYCSDLNCHRLVLDWTSLGLGKFGENPRLCRNCDGVKASSQNTRSERTKNWYPKIHYSWRCIGKELDSVIAEHAICPDIYHPAVARDGLLTRLRIPGGVLTTAQCVAIEQLLTATGLDYLQVTNRANLQLRALTEDIDQELLTTLTDCGLAASDRAVDGIRNIMLSPTAGIDSQELVDVRSLANAWQEYLTDHPELGILSTKFSVGFDGGGSVEIVDRPNDITLLAVSDREFELYLGMGVRGSAPLPVGVRLGLGECIPMLAAISQSYRQGIEILGRNARRKPRLRDVINHWGLTGFSEIVQREFMGSSHFIFKNLDREGDLVREDGNYHLGIHRQSQPDRSYLGVVLPLGRWHLAQVKGLAEIADRYGSGTIRLTPWQNLILPDVKAADLATVQLLITDLGLIHTANHPSSLLRACAGSTGCQFGATDTQRDAIDLSTYLAASFELDRPLNIHFSGCDKSCAQHDRADITLWGVEATESYRIEIAGATAEVRRELSDLYSPAQVPMAIGHLIDAYHYQRLNPQESFQAFITRQPLAQLQQILNVV